MAISPPKSIFRYRPLSDYTYSLETAETLFERELNALNERYIYAPPFSSMNDPSEALIQFLHGSDKLLDAISPSLTNFIDQQVNELKLNAGLACFSESHTNSALWGTYANSHTGICLEYDTKDISTISGTNGPSFFKVEYSDEPHPRIPYGEVLTPAFLETLYKIFQRKSSQWKHEQEWRIVTGKRGKLYYPEDALLTIYLGANILPHHQDIICEKFSASKTTIKKAIFDGYSIKFHDIS